MSAIQLPTRFQPGGGGSIVVDSVSDPNTRPHSTDYKVAYHDPSGPAVIAPEEIDFIVPPGSDLPGSRGNPPGRQFFEMLKSHYDPLNANYLDAYLNHPERIPAYWKRNAEGRIRFICFFGTTLNTSWGSEIVRYLCWDTKLMGGPNSIARWEEDTNGEWYGGDKWIDFQNGFSNCDVAIIRRR